MASDPLKGAPRNSSRFEEDMTQIIHNTQVYRLQYPYYFFNTINNKYRKRFQQTKFLPTTLSFELIT